MAGGRTLVVNLVANTNSFGRGMKSAVRNADGFQGKVGALAHSMKRVLGPALIAAGAAAAAMAVKMGVDGVKAAMENERTASALATTLRNLGKAHEAAGVEDFIAKLESSTGIVDDKLRPALGRLVIATEDVDEAQVLLGKSLDAAIGLNKDFGSVVEAVSKAVQTGNAGPLSRYGIILDDNKIATEGFTAALDEALDKFKGLQAAEAATLQGQLRILSVEADNVKEAFGRGLLKSLSDTTDGISDVSQTLRDLQPAFEAFGESVGKTIRDLGTLVQAVQKVSDSIPDFVKDLPRLLGFQAGFHVVMAIAESLTSSNQEATQATTDLVAQTGKYQDAAARAARSGSGLQQGMEDLSDSTDDAVDSLANLNSWISRTTTVLEYKESWDNLTKSLKENGLNLDDNTKKGRDNIKALIEAARKTADYSMQQDTATQKVAAAGEGLDKLRDVLNTTKMSPETRASLIEPFQQLIFDLDDGINDVSRLQSALNNLKGKSILIEFRTNLNNLPERVRREFYGVATGGLIRGPGGPKADQVGPFMLSNGEFVVQAASVKKFGVDFFESLNRGMDPLGGAQAPGPSRSQPVSTGGSRSLVIQSLNVNAAPGERAESSVPRSLRRLAWVSGLNG